jgi:fucose permease
MPIQFCFFLAYFVVSLPSGFLVEKRGYKRGIVVGLSVAAVGEGKPALLGAAMALGVIPGSPSGYADSADIAS